MDNIKLYGVRMEVNTVRDPTSCKEMEHCHFFESNIFIVWIVLAFRRKLGDWTKAGIVTYWANKDLAKIGVSPVVMWYHWLMLMVMTKKMIWKQLDISKNFSFCNVVLKTAVVIAEVIFDHYVNNCFFPQILERKITIMEKDAGQN